MAKKGKDENRIHIDLKDLFVKNLSFENNVLKFGTNVTVQDIVDLTNIKIQSISKTLGIKSVDNNHILDEEQIAEISLANGFDFEKIQDVSEENVVDVYQDLISNYKWDKEVKIEKRPPIITIMGHVDHGKTTLLDTIRKTNITEQEFGGITQKIGAYQVEFKNKTLTFIDTPGHEAFTQMRANGSKVTDISVIVVAADDSLMPQTKESIDHVKSANVPFIVAVNKIDAPGANVSRIKNELRNINVIAEDMGGDIPFIEISALKNQNIDKLMENIILLSDMGNLDAVVNTNASGVVIESNVHKNRGNTVTIMIKNGTLKQGDQIILDDFICSAKIMHDFNGNIIKEATPGTPVELFGIGKSAIVGSKFVVYNSKFAQKIADVVHSSRLNKLRKVEKKSVSDLFEIMNNNKKKFNLIIKANTLGVLDAITQKIESFGNEEIEVKIIRSDIGEVTSTDISLAEASKASFYTFDLKVSSQTQQQLRSKGISIFNFNIIYKLFEDLEEKINGLKEDKFEEKKIGELEIQQVFSFSKVGNIAGCIVKDGSIRKDSIIEVIRNGQVVAKEKVESLRVEKDNVKEVLKGRECGVVAEDSKKIDIKEGDKIIAYELIKI